MDEDAVIEFAQKNGLEDLPWEEIEQRYTDSVIAKAEHMNDELKCRNI